MASKTEKTVHMPCQYRHNLKRLLALSLSFSVLVHLAFVLFFLKFPASSKDLEAFQESPVEVKILSLRDSSDLLENMNGQIVDLVDKLPESKPDKHTKYLSDKSRRVEKETQSLETGIDPNAPFTSTGGGFREDRLSLSEKANPSRIKEDAGHKTADGVERGLNLNPSQDELSRLVATAPNNYLPGVSIGNATLLNTRDFAFAGYFIRIKRQMEAVWDPKPILYRTSTEKRPIYKTSVDMILDEKGKVISMTVLKSSQVKELDEEAIRTIRHSAPYPNPPRELLAPDGKIYISDWNFIITTGKGLF